MVTTITMKELMNENKFKYGDRVRIKDNYFSAGKRGQVGKVSNASIRNAFVPGLVGVILDNSQGEELAVADVSLELVADEKPVEGAEIARKDIKVGQTIRVSFETVIGSYKQTSTKEGIVTRIKESWSSEGNTPIVKPEEAEITLSFGSSKETFTLIKDAPEVDEIAEALEKLAPGSVAQVDGDGFGKFLTTFIKTSKFDENAQSNLWTEHDSRFPTNNRVVSESRVRESMQSLDQIVVSL
jgi:hypothetical protein